MKHGWENIEIFICPANRGDCNDMRIFFSPVLQDDPSIMKNGWVDFSSPVKFKLTFLYGHGEALVILTTMNEVFSSFGYAGF